LDVPLLYDQYGRTLYAASRSDPVTGELGHTHATGIGTVALLAAAAVSHVDVADMR
jgi:hypothetical protein